MFETVTDTATKTNSIAAACFACGLLALVGCLAWASMPAATALPRSSIGGEPVLILRQTNELLGPHDRLVAVVQSESQLKKLPMNSCPTVDFTRESAVVVAMGWRSSTGYSIVIRRLELKDNVLHVYVKQWAPSGMAGAFPTAPYSIVIVDKLPENLQLKLHGANVGFTSEVGPQHAPPSGAGAQ